MYVEFRFFRRFTSGRYKISRLCFRDIRAEGVQTSGGGVHIPVGLRAVQDGRPIGEGRADQQPVGLGLGGDNRNIAL